MKSFLLLVFLVSATASVEAQSSNCTIENIPANDKAALLRFWQSFKHALNKRDIAALRKLCVFPMESTFTANRDNDEVIITASSFTKQHYKIFKHPLLLKLVSEKDIMQIVSPTYGNKETCTFQFGFGVKDSPASPGWSRHMVIEKRNGRYVVVRLFNVP